MTPTPAPGSAEFKDALIAAIKTVQDPEIPVDLYELGLDLRIGRERRRRRESRDDADHAELPRRRNAPGHG